MTKSLEDSDEFVRKNAAEALGRIGPVSQAEVPALTKLLGDDSDEDVRKGAGDALGEHSRLTHAVRRWELVR